MGQRLNFEVWNKGKVVGNCYYHWRGFTSTALTTMQQAIDFIQSQPHVVKNLADEEVRAYVEQLFIATGADNEDRSNGLYNFDKEGIQDTRYWAEATMCLYLDEERIDAEELFYMENIYDFMDQAGIDYSKRKELELPLYSFSLRHLSYEEVEEVFSAASQESSFQEEEYPHIVFTAIE